jgi:Rho-binding antiterminator
MQPYQPIDCNQYDQLLAWATNRKTVQARFLDETGGETVQEGVIVDVYTHHRAEYLVLSSLTNPLRLDRLLQVDGMALNTCATSNKGN